MYNEQQHYVICKLKELASELGRNPMKHELQALLPRVNFDILFGPSYDYALSAAGLLKQEFSPPVELRQPKLLIFDIECKPLKVWSWGLFDQNIGIDMIIEDWSVMSWAAKWLGKPEIFYQDVSNQKDFKDDELIVRGIWELLHECDVVITQNGIRFDVPKLNGKFEEYGLGPPAPFKHIDTMRIAKKLGLTSKKLAFMTNKFNDNFKKLDHEKFAGFKLWDECLKGNKEAWAEMKEYNIHDVLATEELYINHYIKWDTTINHGVYSGVPNCCTNCGSTDIQEMAKHNYKKSAVYKSFQCRQCKSFSTGKENLLTKSISKTILK